VASETLTGRATRGGRRGALALAIAATLALAGCEQLKEIGRMVGLGGDEPPTAPTPQPRPARPPAGAGGAPAAASPAAASPAAGVARPAPSPTGVAGQIAAARLANPPAPAPAPTPGQPAAAVLAAATPQAPRGMAPTPAASPAAVPAASPGVAPVAPSAAQPAASPAATGLTLALAETPYDPTGRRDPFRPYVTAADLAARKAREQLAPLQKLELSQIKLVAIVWGLTSNHAMVEDPAGIGYVLRVGTKVGANGGRVSRIAPDAVYIEESFKDGSGAVLTNEITLRLPGPAGGKRS
jgi:type IV pilus assembly protein PilP